MSLTPRDNVVFTGYPRTPGTACGRLKVSDVELSFWGGINQPTGEVIDRSHPLSGQSIKDTVLAIPGGRGSCSGSLVMMELMLNNAGPKAIILERPDSIITLGVLMTEEFFDKSIPIVEFGQKHFKSLLELDGQTIWVDSGKVSTARLVLRDDDTICTKDELTTTITLSAWDKDAVSGVHMVQRQDMHCI
jgi:predicted aconitase with swiveling domain